MSDTPLSAEDAALDAEWRATFGQPLPIIGAADIARAVLDKAKQARRDDPARPALDANS